jgi:hypothetical protein
MAGDVIRDAVGDHLPYSRRAHLASVLDTFAKIHGRE